MKIDWIQRVIKRFLLKIKKGKKRYKKIDWFRQKLCIPDHEIYESIEHKVKSKIGTIFVNEDILEEYSVKIYENIYKLMIMVNNIYCLELIFILINIG